MRILHIIPGINNASGPTHVLMNLCSEVAAMGHNVSVYHLTGRNLDEVALVTDRIEVLGFPVRFLKKWCYSPALGRKLHHVIKQFDIIHIHSLWLYPNVSACRYAMKYGIPYIIRPIGSLEPWCLDKNRWIKKAYMAMFERKHLDRASAMHVASNQEADNIRKLNIKSKIVIVPNGINIHEFENLPGQEVFRKRLGIPDKMKMILYLGRIDRIKGIDILIRAFHMVQKVMQNTILVIAGPVNNNYSRTLEKRVASDRLAGKIIFPDELRGEEKLGAYAAADVFVLPSHSENFGIVVAEAMASGLPVVASRKTPWNDVEKYNTGCWVELNPVEIANAILRILENPELSIEMGRNGKALVNRKFNWSSIAARMVGVYGDIIAGREIGKRYGDGKKNLTDRGNYETADFGHHSGKK